MQKKSSSGSAILKSKGVKQIAMKFVRDVGKSDLQDAWVDGFKKNVPSKYNFYKARIKGTSNYYKDFPEGSLVCIHRSQKPSFGGFLEVPLRNSILG